MPSDCDDNYFFLSPEDHPEKIPKKVGQGGKPQDSEFLFVDEYNRSALIAPSRSSFL